MTGSFYIGAYWASRNESLAGVVSKTTQTLKILSELDEQFYNWYEKGMSRKQGLQSKLSIEPGNIEKVYLKSVKAKPGVKTLEEDGFSINLWSGHEDEESGSISFNVGGTFNISTISNAIVIKIPGSGAARERLLQPQIAKSILNIVAITWDPDYAVFTSHELRDKLNAANKIGWITYHRSIRKLPVLPYGIIYERTGTGHLFTVVSTDYSPDDATSKLLKIKDYLLK